MNHAQKRRLDELQAILGRYTDGEGCAACGAPWRIKHKRLWLVDTDRIPRCPGCARLVDSDGARPVEAQKIIHMEQASA